MKLAGGSLGSLDWSQWLYGLFSAVIGGGAGAATAGVGANLVVPNLNSHQTLSIMGMTFVVSGLFNGLAFLHSSPLPAVTTTEKTVSSLTAGPAGAVTASKTTETKTIQTP